MSRNAIVRRVHLYYIVSRYLSGMSVGDAIQLDHAEAVFKWSNRNHSGHCIDKFIVTSPVGWKAKIVVLATSWGYAATIESFDRDGNMIAIDDWLRCVAEHHRN